MDVSPMSSHRSNGSSSNMSSRMEIYPPLLPIEDCLFGPSRECPSMIDEDQQQKQQDSRKKKKDAEQNQNQAHEQHDGNPQEDTSKNQQQNQQNQHLDMNNDNGNGDATAPPKSKPPASPPTAAEAMEIKGALDDFDLGHWGEVARQERIKHVINLPQLRKISLQGIPDEQSLRGIAWRVLLGYLPKQIEKWKSTMQPQRALYNSLVQQFFGGPYDAPAELRGHHSKKLQRDSTLRNKYNQVQRLDYESESEYEDGNDPNDGSDDENEDSSYFSTPTPRRKSSLKIPPDDQIPMHQKLQKLPPKLREQWKRCGLMDKTINNYSQEQRSLVHLGINKLKLDPAMFSNNQQAEEDSSSATAVSPEQQEAFDAFLQNAQTLEEIRKDVVRTHPDLYFFLEPQQNLGLRRYAALERILFVWSKLNKGVCYVQGMNEIVGTLFYVLANDVNYEWACHAEADTYFLFHTLMIEMRDVFVPALDEHETGIQGRISQLDRLLKTHDPEVHWHLHNECGIDASFYAIRWLTTLLSREFLLPDTIRLWDAMLASTHKENFLRYVCGTMVLLVRDELLKGDLSTCLRLLQSYPPCNVDLLLESSRSLWIYESQITLACHKGGISLHQALQTISPPPSIVMAFGLRGGVVAPVVTPNKKSSMSMLTPPTTPQPTRLLTAFSSIGSNSSNNTANNNNSNNSNYNVTPIKNPNAASAPSTSALPPDEEGTLFGRAKRLWNGWSKHQQQQQQQQHTPAPPPPKPAPQSAEPRISSGPNGETYRSPPRSRLWNRESQEREKQRLQQQAVAAATTAAVVVPNDGTIVATTTTTVAPELPTLQPQPVVAPSYLTTPSPATGKAPVSPSTMNDIMDVLTT